MNKSFRITAAAVLTSFSLGLVTAPAQAALIGTEHALSQAQQGTESQNPVNRAELKSFFEREDVARVLEQQGLSAEQAKARVDTLTEDEARQLAAQIENAPAGAGIIGVLFTVFVILLVTDILGFTKVFPFTRSVR